MQIDPRWADLVIGSKVSAGVQGFTSISHLAATVDRVLVLDQDLAYYAPTLGARCWLRVMHDGQGGWKDAPAHAAAIAPVIYRVYQYGVRDVLFGNEQIALEGLGAEPDDYRFLNDWGCTMLRELHSLLPLPGLRYWGPALSPGHQEDDGFDGYRLLADYLVALDGIAVHNYWRPDGGFIGDPDFEWWAGRIERAYRLVTSMGIHKPWAVTEFNRKVDRGNPDDIAAYANQCQRYYQWLNSLDYVVAGFTFLYTCQDQAFADLTWDLMLGMVERMQQFDRQSEGQWALPVVPPELPIEDPAGDGTASAPALAGGGNVLTTIGNGYEVIDLRANLPKADDYPQRELSAIKYLVIHHSAVAVDSTAESIARYHVEQLGWPGIGYQWIVHQDGRTEYCQDISRASYNVAGRNGEVIGICLPGDWTSHAPPEAQLIAARRLVAEIQYALGWFVPVVGHSDVALAGYGTACPGNSWPTWREAVTVKLDTTPVPPPAYQFVLGFKDLADRLGAAAGMPLENEHPGQIQETSTGYLLWTPGKAPVFVGK